MKDSRIKVLDAKILFNHFRKISAMILLMAMVGLGATLGIFTVSGVAHGMLLLDVKDELAVDFGFGLYIYDEGSGWTGINSSDPVDMVAVDFDEDGQDELVVSYSFGLYIYEEGVGWTSINSSLPEKMITINTFE